MPATYVFTNETTSSTFTSVVESAQLQQGRQRYLDSYAGGRLAITINNSNDDASGFTLGDEIRVAISGHTNPTNYQTFWVDDIQFYNERSDFAAARAVIICIDGVARLGQVDITGLSLTATTTLQQFVDMMTDAFGSGTASGSGALSVPSATTYTGSLGARANELIVTEGGAFRMNYDGSVSFIGRGSFSDSTYIKPYPIFARQRDDVQLDVGYTDLAREQYGTVYANDITVVPSGLDPQRAANITSLPRKSDSYITVDNTETQALGLAQFQRTMRSDLSNQTLVVRWSDEPYEWAVSGSNSIYVWYGAFFSGFYGFYNVQYELPDGSEYDQRFFLEGYTADLLNTGTRYTLYFSPISYYQYFTLDSTTLGRLDSGRLGW